MNQPIDLAWPVDGIEQVEACPYCQSVNRTLAYEGVQDWAFECAPGQWNYWDCDNCQSLYLHPRPTLSTIGAAYAKYYTHDNAATSAAASSLKSLARNECLSHVFGISIEPRLQLPKPFNSLTAMVSKKVAIPFGWHELASLPKGAFVDVGCGAGLTVNVAKQLGWQAMGLEIDPSAVELARRNGLNIVEGTYHRLSQHESQFDCIMLSHVLEHVHNPLDLLAKLKSALKPGGVLLVSLPNALSALRYHFGANWRGLEAPRHIAIPSQPSLIALLEKLGFNVTSQADGGLPTAAESFRITRRGSAIQKGDMAMARQLDIAPSIAQSGNDFIKLVCKLPTVTCKTSCDATVSDYATSLAATL